ncbi:tyrosine-type recombinase/integrase [Microcoleus sp. D2_18a_D3]|uniref:tyrosine-type recombinase/integrase n=1 Tax=Microcoleus sp. D2_18a_D3 TaxID=3055330 RepID=UPI002FD27017
MYAKTQAIPETVKVQSDNGTLRLQFSTKYNPIFGGKRKHQGLSLKDTPDNWQKAIAIAYRIEGDLQHPDWQQLFDPSFAKYGLKTKYAAELKLAAPIPEPEPEMTVGAMWEDYLTWKRPQLEETTYRLKFVSTYSNVVKGLVWDSKLAKFTESNNTAWNLPISPAASEIILQHPVSDSTKTAVLQALSEAFKRLQSLGKINNLPANPFVCTGKFLKNTADKYKPIISATGDEREWWDTEHKESGSNGDYRAFTREERDIIIKTFYESTRLSCQQVAPLIEFLFLTGCRPGEAFALRWQDIGKGKDGQYIVFAKSYNGKLKNTQVTKTKETRLFRIYPKLEYLLSKIKPTNLKSTDLVFVNTEGNPYNTGNISELWQETSSGKGENRKSRNGIVTQLAKDGKISNYLPPYHTRHTFISLQAHAGTDLLLLATACGNSVEIIQRHYLGINTTVEMVDI